MARKLDAASEKSRGKKSVSGEKSRCRIIFSPEIVV